MAKKKTTRRRKSYAQSAYERELEMDLKNVGKEFIEVFREALNERGEIVITKPGYKTIKAPKSELTLPVKQIKWLTAHLLDKAFITSRRHFSQDSLEDLATAVRTLWSHMNFETGVREAFVWLSNTVEEKKNAASQK